MRIEFWMSAASVVGGLGVATAAVAQTPARPAAPGAGWRYMSIDYAKAGTERQLFNLQFNGPRVSAAYAW